MTGFKRSVAILFVFSAIFFSTITAVAQKGGYESSVSFYGKDLGDVIVKGMLETANPLTD